MHKKLNLLVVLLVFGWVNFSFAQYQDWVGQETTVESAGDFVIVQSGLSQNSFNALISARMSLSRRDYLALLMSHNAFELSSGTAVKILAVNFVEKAVKVKILSGSDKDKEGWVLLNEINPKIREANIDYYSENK